MARQAPNSAQLWVTREREKENNIPNLRYKEVYEEEDNVIQ